MKKILYQTFWDLYAIFFATIIAFVLSSFVFPEGLESTMDTYCMVLFLCTLLIFVYDKEVSTIQKIYGVFFVAIVSCITIYMWLEFGAKDLVLPFLALGYPLLFTITKQFYKYIIGKQFFSNSK